jgi:hypothetical protein
MLDRIEARLLAEGISDKAKDFFAIINKVTSLNAGQLLSILKQHSEGVFNDITTISEESAKAPKGELAELARGVNHRLIAARFPTVDDDEMVFYLVVPSKNFDGEEFTDSQILSSIQTKIKDLYQTLMDGGAIDSELESIFRDRETAERKLQELEKHVVYDKHEPPKNQNDNQKDLDNKPVPGPIPKGDNRELVLEYIKDLFPEEYEASEKAMRILRPGQLEQGISQFQWDQGSIASLARSAAFAVGAKIEGMKTVKLIAGLALAFMATWYLSTLSS